MIMRKTRKILLSLSAAAMILTLSGSAFAVPAYDGYRNVTLSDGSTAKLSQRGDEFVHWFEDERGFAVLRAPNGRFEFAVKGVSGMLTASGRAYSPKIAAPAAAVKNYVPNKDTAVFKIGSNNVSAPQSLFARTLSSVKTALTGWSPKHVSGKRNLMVVRVNFVNRDFQTEENFYMDKVWKEGTDSLSVRQYYLDQSYETLKVVSADYSGSAADAPYGLITVSLDASCFNGGEHPDRLLSTSSSATTIGEYLQNTANDHAAEVAVINDILKKVTAATSADFTKFDADNSGTITPDELCFYMIFAGYEESYSGYVSKDYPMVWAHAWEPFAEADYKVFALYGINVERADHEVTVSGKKLGKWAMQGELGYSLDDKNNVTSTSLPGTGTMTHELGHQMCSLPDLYDTSYTNEGMGVYSLMALGSWGATRSQDNGEIPGVRPVNLDAWSRIYLGWESPSKITAAVEKSDVTFGRAFTKAIVRLQSPAADSATEYLLAEVRDPKNDKWDSGMQQYLCRLGDVPFQNGAVLIQHIDEKSGSGALSLGNDINAYTTVPHQGVVPLAAGRNYRDFKGTGYNVALPADFWYDGNETLTELGENGGKYFAGKSYFYNGKEKYTALTRSGIVLTSFSPSADSMTASLCYDEGKGSMAAARAVTPTIAAKLESYIGPLYAQVVNTTAAAAALLAPAGFTAEDLSLDDSSQTTLSAAAVKSAVLRASAVFPLPIFSATASGKTLNSFAFVVPREQLLAKTPQAVRLYKISGKGKSLPFAYTDVIDPTKLKDGSFTIQKMTDTVAPKDAELTDDSYKITMFIADNGAYDLDTNLGTILDPAAIVSQTQSSSGGCSAGFGIMALLLLLPFAAKKRN